MSAGLIGAAIIFMWTPKSPSLAKATSFRLQGKADRIDLLFLSFSLQAKRFANISLTGSLSEDKLHQLVHSTNFFFKQKRNQTKGAHTDYTKP